MAEIGLYFGSFNPVHYGHLRIAEYFHQVKNFKEIWYVLSPQNPFKEKTELAPVATRLRMLENATASQTFAKISTIELSMPLPHYTYHTLQFFIKEYPQHRFTILMGEDNYHALGQWYRGDWIREHFPVLFYPRRENSEGQKTEPESPHHIDISASIIREKIENGRPLNGLVPPGVERIIHEEKLYLR